MTIVRDIRGDAYKNNIISVVNGNVTYCGMPVMDIVKSDKPLFPSSIYTLLGVAGLDIADIALKPETFESLHSLLHSKK